MAITSAKCLIVVHRGCGDGARLWMGQRGQQSKYVNIFNIKSNIIIIIDFVLFCLQINSLLSDHHNEFLRPPLISAGGAASPPLWVHFVHGRRLLLLLLLLLLFMPLPLGACFFGRAFGSARPRLRPAKYSPYLTKDLSHHYVNEWSSVAFIT